MGRELLQKTKAEILCLKNIFIFAFYVEIITFIRAHLSDIIREENHNFD